ncbi:MAG: hypothetical protein EXR73_01085 [Myxococcales bacterium]|nr:hypothetical protein [Myxococcales bacterium]
MNRGGSQRLATLGALLLAVGLAAAAWWGVAGAGDSPQLAPPVVSGAPASVGRSTATLPAIAPEAERHDDPVVRPRAGMESGEEDDFASGDAKSIPIITQPVLLHVLDAETKAELRDVTVRRDPQDRSDEGVEGLLGEFNEARMEPHEGRWRPTPPNPRGLPFWLHGDAPIHLAPDAPAARCIERLWVTAAGHELASLRVDWTSGGERFIELRPAGSVIVAITNATDSDEGGFPMLEIRGYEPVRQTERFDRGLADLTRQLKEHDRTPSSRAATVQLIRRAMESLRSLREAGNASDDRAVLGRALGPLLPDVRSDEVEGGKVRLDALAAGRWRFAVYDRAASGVPLVACADTWVEPGREARVELTCTSPPPIALVACAGTLVVASEWLAHGGYELPARINCRQSFRRGLGFITADWDVDLVATGEKGVLRFDAGQAWPGELTLRALRARGMPIGLPTQQVGAEGGDLVVEIAPPVVSEPAKILKEGAADGTDADVPAELTIVLRDRAAIVPFEPAYTVVASGGAKPIEHVRAAPIDDSPAWRGFFFKYAGIASLVVYDVPGYLPSEPIDVELRPGATASVTIPLRRRN